MQPRNDLSEKFVPWDDGSGNILNVPKGILCHQVNCQAVMGSGVARSIRDKWPVVYERYRNAEQKLGNVQLVPVGSDLLVANLWGQDHFSSNKRHTNYEAVFVALTDLQERWIEGAKGRPSKDRLPVVFPYKMSSDRGGGSWSVIRTMIEVVFPDAYIAKLGFGIIPVTMKDYLI